MTKHPLLIILLLSFTLFFSCISRSSTRETQSTDEKTSARKDFIPSDKKNIYVSRIFIPKAIQVSNAGNIKRRHRQFFSDHFEYHPDRGLANALSDADLYFQLDLLEYFIQVIDIYQPTTHLPYRMYIKYRFTLEDSKSSEFYGRDVEMFQSIVFELPIDDALEQSVLLEQEKLIFEQLTYSIDHYLLFGTIPPSNELGYENIDTSRKALFERIGEEDEEFINTDYGQFEQQTNAGNTNL